MARIERVIAPGYPHHITQRGNRRQQTFFCDDDYLAYIELMAEWCQTYKVDIWAWCLMPNHVHLIAVPTNTEGLTPADEVETIHRHEGTGRPLGSEGFVDNMETVLAKRWRPQKTGPKGKRGEG